MPYTQTLPLVLLHKESLISKLLSRLHLKAKLSLEPIIRYASPFVYCYILLSWGADLFYDEMVTTDIILCSCLPLDNNNFKCHCFICLQYLFFRALCGVQVTRDSIWVIEF